MASFRAPSAQAAWVMQQVQGREIKSVGSVRDYEQGLTRVAEWQQAEHPRLAQGLRGMTQELSLDQILIPCAIRSLAARKPSSLLCRASQPSQRAPQLAIPVRLLSIKPPSLAIAM